MDDPCLHVGQTLVFDADPFHVPLPDAVRHERHGGVLVEDGRIAAVGPADALRAAHPTAAVTDHGAALILPGFVDAHVHYPQTAIIASWGKRLIDWLETYTFPEEMRFADEAHARATAGRYLDLVLAHGTTTVASYCTIHPGSVDAFFEAAAARGLRAVAGKTCMDRNAPEGLRDSPRAAYDESRALIARWHGTGRLSYAITPRFSPTSSPEQLEALGALWAAHPDCLMQTHLSEQTDECAVGGRALSRRRATTSTPTNASASCAPGPSSVMPSTCPTGSAPACARPTRPSSTARRRTPSSGRACSTWTASPPRANRIGLATDTGGGSSFSMLRTMAAAYEVAQLRGRALHPAELLWLATAGSARALRLDDRIGRLAAGMEADLVVIDLASTPAIAQRAARAEDVWEAVFPTIMMGDDRAVRATYVMGREVRRP
jgi:guanine deaminase